MPQVVVDFVANTKGLQKGIADTGKASGGFASKLKGMAKFGALAGGAAGVGALVATLKIGFDEFKQGQQVAAQTNAAIKSTGGVANVTAGHVSKLATALMKKSGVDDEAIASGENLLLAFTNVRNEVGKGSAIFDRATQAALDLSTRLGTSMPAASKLLGKALNDPIKGMTSLSKIGVHFTDAQKKQITALVKSGHTLQAQKIIMGQVEDKYKGAAAAAGKTLPGQINIAKETFNNFAGDLVAKLIPAVQTTITWLVDHWPQIKTIIINAWNAIKPTIDAFAGLVKQLVDTIRSNWGTIGPIIDKVVQIFKDKLKTITDTIKLFTDLLKGDWSKAWDDVKTIVSDVWQQIVDTMKLVLPLIIAAAKAIGTAILNAVEAELKLLPGQAWDLIKLIGQTILDNLPTVEGWAKSLATALINAALRELKALPGQVWEAIKLIGPKLLSFTATIAKWGTDLAIWLAKAAVDELKKLPGLAWDGIKLIGSFLLDKAADIAKWGTGIATSIGKALVDELKNLPGQVWDGIKDIGSFLLGKAGDIKNWGLDLAGKIKDGIVNGLKALPVAIATAIGTAIMNVVNGVIDQVNSLLEFRISIPGGGHLGIPSHIDIDPPNIPHTHLARGGVISRPTLALIGEGPESEIVAPESLMRKLLRENGPAGGDIHVKVFLGDEELRGMVRTEVTRSNNGIARVLLAGSVT